MSAAGVENLMDEVRLLWNAMARAGERLHRNEPVTIATRAVLEFIVRHGPATVPQIARSRGVTRQHIQTLVNALLDQKLVALEPNPAHRRSPLVLLSRDGQRTIERMQARERRYLAGLNLRVSRAGLDRAAGVLAALRTALGGRR